jgi:hypothetical protein
LPTREWLHRVVEAAKPYEGRSGAATNLLKTIL